jgi:aryl-alcohol dehydrogenase-like predicted oxidoreductase
VEFVNGNDPGIAGFVKNQTAKCTKRAQNRLHNYQILPGYSLMKYKLLGNTGLKVSELCLGTMTFGGKGALWSKIGKLDQGSVDEQMKIALDAGINFIDTANVYSEGVSEQLTGQSIKNVGVNRHDLVLATKVRGKTSDTPNGIGLSRKHIFEQIDESLRRLQTDYIDLYQIHGYDEFTPLEETLEALDSLVRLGKVRYIGASNLAAWQLMKALGYSTYNRVAKFVSLQAYYTVAGRDLEREVVPLLLDQKVGLMVWSPLAGGFLSGKYTRESSKEEGSRRISFDFPPIDKERAFDIIDVLNEMAAKKNASIAQLALAWLLHQPAVTTVIIGAKNIDQLHDNLKATEVAFTPDELKRIDAVSKLPAEYPQWMIERQAVDRQKY